MYSAQVKVILSCLGASSPPGANTSRSAGHLKAQNRGRACRRQGTHRDVGIVKYRKGSEAEPQNPNATEIVDRRQMLFALGAGLFAWTGEEARAAYGEGARVFGDRTNSSDYRKYEGGDYKIVLPAKWNPNKSIVEGSTLRYADNMRDDGANMDVIITETSGSSVKDFGSPEQYFSRISYLLGEQTFYGETKSEGGFKPGQISSAALLESGEKTDAAGRTYYTYHILVRTADGEGGGRHHLFSSVIANGKTYTLQVQALDKQWFKGSETTLRKVYESFSLV